MPATWKQTEVSRRLKVLHATGKHAAGQQTGTNTGTMPLLAVSAETIQSCPPPVLRVIRGGLAAIALGAGYLLFKFLRAPIVIAAVAAITGLVPAAQGWQQVIAPAPSPSAASAPHHRRRHKPADHSQVLPAVAPQMGVTLQHHTVRDDDDDSRKCVHSAPSPSPAPSAVPSPISTPSAAPSASQAGTGTPSAA